MSRYDHWKQSLLDTVEHLQPLMQGDKRTGLDEIGEKLRNEVFNLVILGQFKRGKSTFINALLGEDLLPTAIVPLTSVVTVIQYAPQVSVHVHYLDGRVEEAPLSDLPGYITERGNPENREGVREVVIFHPSPYLKDGVRIIDTPGVGSVYTHNTDVAYRYLPYVDAGVFVISADPPLSQSEHQFLKDIGDYVDRLFFIVNKIDQVGELERAESMDFTRTILCKALDCEDVALHPLSARWALEARQSGDVRKLEQSLLPRFEEQLKSFLLNEKGMVLLKSAAQSLLRIVSGETLALRLEQEAARLPLQELNNKISRFEKEMSGIARDKEHHGYLLKGRMEKIAGKLDDEIRTFKQVNLPALHAALEQEYTKKLAEGGKLDQELEAFVFDKIREVFTPWRLQVTEMIAVDLEEAHQELAIRTNEVIERIVTLTGDIFRLSLKTFTTVEPLNQKSRFFFLLKDAPVGLELIRLAVTSSLPRFLVKKMILNNMKTAVSELVDRHCGRVRYDLIQRVQGTVKDFRKTLMERIDQTLEGIRGVLGKAVAMKQQSQADMDRELDDLSRRMASVEGIRENLAHIARDLEHSGD